jgi:hypothetical protein
MHIESTCIDNQCNIPKNIDKKGHKGQPINDNQFNTVDNFDCNQSLELTDEAPSSDNNGEEGNDCQVGSNQNSKSKGWVCNDLEELHFDLIHKLDVLAKLDSTVHTVLICVYSMLMIAK